MKTMDSLRFSLDMYHTLLGQLDIPDLCLNPITMRAAGAVLAMGDKDQPYQETVQALGLPKDYAAIGRWLYSLQNVKSEIVRSLLANGLFLSDRHRWYQEYIDQMGQYALVQPMDFSQPEKRRGEINDWIEGKTEQMIKDLIPSGAITEDQAVVSASAYYFLGGWDEPFPLEYTELDNFFSPTGALALPLMHNRIDLPYYEDAEVQVVCVPYVDGRFFRYVFLPKNDVGLERFEHGFTSKRVEAILNKLDRPTASVKLTYARHKVQPTDSYELTYALMKMGMQLPFSDKANFGRMTPDPFFLNFVYHKAVLIDNELGTEGAGATAYGGFELTGMAGEDLPEVEMRVDRPFITMLTLQNQELREVLFMSRVVNPEAADEPDPEKFNPRGW